MVGNASFHVVESIEIRCTTSRNARSAGEVDLLEDQVDRIGKCFHRNQVMLCLWLLRAEGQYHKISLQDRFSGSPIRRKVSPISRDGCQATFGSE